MTAPLGTETRFVDTRLRGEMSNAIVYIDISEVREGALDELKAGLKDLADFVEAKDQRLHRLQRLLQRRWHQDDRRERASQLGILGIPHGSGWAALTVRGTGRAVVDPHLRRAEREGVEQVGEKARLLGAAPLRSRPSRRFHASCD